MGDVRMTTPTSLGTWRALQRSWTADGVLTALAIDHQGALRRALHPHDPESVQQSELTTFKLDVVEALAPDCSAVLLDPVLSASQVVASGLLGKTGLLMELETADYDLRPLPRHVRIDPDWNVAKIKRMGADGVKLFFYYDPDDPDYAEQQDATVCAAARACARHDIPLYAEPILVGGEPTRVGERVVEAARRTEACGATVLKLEFPAAADAADPAKWQAACEAVSGAVSIPWVLLSAGVPYDVFVAQVEAACRGGASGFIAGRAVWGDAAGIADPSARKAKLDTVVRRRLQELAEIAHRHSRPFTQIMVPPDAHPDWFRTYETIGDIR
ncbi:MAG: tagatose 1,6-diphosphate aldolase [Chloroflexi bacterium]|nr:tagatose 1,6-diphosphate aldolase [Chloroflexota bacterium]